jgi:hypothetical protein
LEARATLDKNPEDPGALSSFIVSQLLRSRAIRGEITLKFAAYLGYLNGKDLYPDFEFTNSEDYVKKVLEGNAQGIYQTRNCR